MMMMMMMMMMVTCHDDDAYDEETQLPEVVAVDIVTHCNQIFLFVENWGGG